MTPNIQDGDKGKPAAKVDVRPLDPAACAARCILGRAPQHRVERRARRPKVELHRVGLQRPPEQPPVWLGSGGVASGEGSVAGGAGGGAGGAGGTTAGGVSGVVAASGSVIGVGSVASIRWVVGVHGEKKGRAPVRIEAGGWR